MVVYPEDTVVLAGDSVLLTCVGYGVPQPSISWERDGETITEDGSKFHRVESALVVEGSVFVRSSLLLCNTSQTDSGNYSCSASNTIREPDTVDFNLTIKSEPASINIQVVSEFHFSYYFLCFCSNSASSADVP